MWKICLTRRWSSSKLERPRRIVIISGYPSEVESQVNAMLDEYTPIAWNFAAVDNRVEVTCLLFHNSVLRMAQLANPGPIGMKH